MSTTDPDRTGSGGIEFRCPACEGEGLRAGRDDRATCPGCGESFSVREADGVVLVEDDGWTATVAFDPGGADGGEGREGRESHAGREGHPD